MPITQDRMIALSAAAYDNLTKLRSIRAGLQDIASNLDVNKLTIADVSAKIASILTSPDMQPDSFHVEAIASERSHFKSVEWRNMRSAARMRLARGNPREGDADIGERKRTKPTAKHTKHASYAPHDLAPTHAMRQQDRYREDRGGVVVEIEPETAIEAHDLPPPPPDALAGIVFGPEPTPIEQSQEILRDIADKEDFERELAALKARNAEKGLTD